MNDRELDELLRQLDPARGVDLPEHSGILGRRIRRNSIGVGSRPGRKRVAAALVATALLTTSTAAAFLVFRDSPSDPVQTLCYGSADLESPGIGAPAKASGIEACFGLWLDGTLGAGDRVPPLTACAVAGRSVAVFPGNDQTCAELGLPVADISIEGPVTQLDNALLESVQGSACPPVALVASEAELLIAELGLDAWQVRVDGAASADRPCASFSIDGTLRTVVIVPIPEAPG